MAHLHVGDDPPCDQTRNLAEQHPLARRHAHHRGRAFVLGRRLRMPGHQEAARMVLEILHLAPHGNPVHVDVGDRHEDRDLHHLLLKVFRLADHLGHHHPAVARCEDQIVVMDPDPPRFAEEGHDEEPEEQQENRASPHQGRARFVDQHPVEEPPDQQAHGTRNSDDLVSFLVDSHISVRFGVTSHKAYRQRRTAPKAAWHRSGRAHRRDPGSAVPNP